MRLFITRLFNSRLFAALLFREQETSPVVDPSPTVSDTAIRLHLVKSNASTATAIGLFGQDGGVRELADNERVVIDACQLSTGAAGYVFDDRDGDSGLVNDTGEVLVELVAAGSVCQTFPDGLPCGRGRAPKLKTSSAGAAFSGSGHIIRE